MTACSSEPEIDCASLCESMADKGCELVPTTSGGGGATAVPATGDCQHECLLALSDAHRNGCEQAWNDYMACLVDAPSLTCDGPRFDDVQGCDAERSVWDRCDGMECDRRGGLSGGGTLDDGRDYTLSYGFTDCACEPGVTSHPCGEVSCPSVCCCEGTVGAHMCIDGQCASEQEACEVLMAWPYSLCSDPSR